jgi:hypothetical protein
MGWLKGKAMDREQRLAETFVELADTLVLQVVAARRVELLDVAAAGLVLAVQSGTLATVAASDERARLLELFEVQDDEGSCRDRYQRHLQPRHAHDHVVGAHQHGAIPPPGRAPGQRHGGL